MAKIKMPLGDGDLTVEQVEAAKKGEKIKVRVGPRWADCWEPGGCDFYFQGTYEECRAALDKHKEETGHVG